MGTAGSVVAAGLGEASERDCAAGAGATQEETGFCDRTIHIRTTVAARNAKPPTTAFFRQLEPTGPGGSDDIDVSAVIVSAASRLGEEGRIRSLVPTPDRR
jgi:hypothetical protein